MVKHPTHYLRSRWLGNPSCAPSSLSPCILSFLSRLWWRITSMTSSCSLISFVGTGISASTTSQNRPV